MSLTPAISWEALQLLQRPEFFRSSSLPSLHYYIMLRCRSPNLHLAMVETPFQYLWPPLFPRCRTHRPFIRQQGSKSGAFIYTTPPLAEMSVFSTAEPTKVCESLVTKLPHPQRWYPSYVSLAPFRRIANAFVASNTEHDES